MQHACRTVGFISFFSNNVIKFARFTLSPNLFRNSGKVPPQPQRSIKIGIGRVDGERWR